MKTENLDDIQKLLWTFATHRVITVAAKTGVLTRLSEEPGTGDSVARYLELDVTATTKLLRSLSAHGFLTSNGESYSVKETLREFFLPGTTSLIPFIAHSHKMYDSFGENLEAWVRGGTWTTQIRDRESVLNFALAMQAMGQGVAGQLVSKVSLEGTTRMLDVGGGLGHYSKALLAENPALTATVFDTGVVAEMGRERAVEPEFEGRLTFKGGDYLEDDYGSGFDFVLLANTLHQELKNDAAKMVKKAAAAVNPGGQVGVVDFAIDDQSRAHVLGSLFAINMRSFGDTYTEPTIRGWMEDAGLVDVVRNDLSDYRWFIAAKKRRSK